MPNSEKLPKEVMELLKARERTTPFEPPRRHRFIIPRTVQNLSISTQKIIFTSSYTYPWIKSKKHKK